ncbi:MAG: 4-carboxy-4-hydroxy-2-oxoadipate aldolase/oxaloacetate decarboxylase [Paracoccaceae bacterium]|nr:MAG: 4-carboxy-4-hydroxy-2-oxoadipate aldolase/oxaloacetate decarboxylase [Paracoccaceae bacterium]
MILALGAFQTATLHEALGRTGAMPHAIKPIYPGMRLAGPALTVSCPPGDNLTIHAAIEHARPGDVMVVDFNGELEAGPFGDILATACMARGITGLVIDGCVRDGTGLRDLGFPVFARGLNMKGTTKTAFGTLGQPIVCAGVQVAPGDIVIGDDDGVVVVPADRAAEILMAAEKRDSDEEIKRQHLREGALTVDLLGLRRYLPQ